MGPSQSREGREQGSQSGEFALSCVHPFSFLLCSRLFIMQLILLCVFIRAVIGVFSPFSVFPDFVKCTFVMQRRKLIKRKSYPSPLRTGTLNKSKGKESLSHSEQVCLKQVALVLSTGTGTGQWAWVSAHVGLGGHSTASLAFLPSWEGSRCSLCL